MPMNAAEIEHLKLLIAKLQRMQFRDLAGDGDHYAASVRSQAFKGKSRVAQHQMVYAALQGRMGGTLHALALQTAPKD